MTRYLKSKIATGVMSIGLLLGLTGDGLATPSCGSHDKITSTLATQYNEVPLHRGLTPKGTMVEVFSSSAGTFSVVVTLPTGMSCLVTAGTHWQELNTASHDDNSNIEKGIDRDF